MKFCIYFIVICLVLCIFGQVLSAIIKQNVTFVRKWINKTKNVNYFFICAKTRHFISPVVIDTHLILTPTCVMYIRTLL